VTETRVALVTGANRGIGLEIVRQLARIGVLPVLGARDPAKGKIAADGLKSEGFDIPVVALDVGDETSVNCSVDEAQRLFGRLDILVNNAGILVDGPSTGANLVEVPLDLVTRTFDTNVLGPMRMIRAVAPLMRATGYGRIVNLSSGLGQLAEMGGGWPAYRISKAALNAVTRIASAELGDKGIKVNAVCPGWVKTDMGGPDAERPVEKGAETAVWLATLPDDGPTGGIFRDQKPIAW
jgi:NAD(P)-dependent dehydrogenase (short-subunit alcohol dehydrogenase family)